MEKVIEFLKAHHTYYLATMNGDQPEVRPFGTAALFEGKLYIQTGMSKDVFRQIQANPKVSICCFDGQSTWLRLNATAVIDERAEASAAVLAEYPELQHMYAPGDGNCVVVALTEATARFCSFTQPEEVVTF